MALALFLLGPINVLTSSVSRHLKTQHGDFAFLLLWVSPSFLLFLAVSQAAAHAALALSSIPLAPLLWPERSFKL